MDALLEEEGSAEKEKWQRLALESLSSSQAIEKKLEASSMQMTRPQLFTQLRCCLEM